jgi:hypothetical protein
LTDSITPPIGGKHSPGNAPIPPRSKADRPPIRIDGRTRSARRLKAIQRALTDDFGGDAALSEPTRILVKHVASLTLQTETLQARIAASGEEATLKSFDQLTRLSNVLSRALKSLGAKRPAPKRAANPLLEHFSRPVAK